jgi:hypothetical protein
MSSNPHIEDLQPIELDPQDPVLRPHKSAIESIVGESYRLEKIAVQLEQRDPEIQAALDIACDGLMKVLLDPQLRRQAFEYCAIGAQVHESTERIEKRLRESEDKVREKYHGGVPPRPVREYIDAVMDYVLALDMIDPVAELDPPLPELAMIQSPQRRVSAVEREQLLAAVYERIGNNYAVADGAGQFALISFLAELSISKYAIAYDDSAAQKRVVAEARSHLRQNRISDSAQNDLLATSSLLNDYFYEYVRYLQERTYGRPTTELQQASYPDYDELSALPQALGLYMVETRDPRCIFKYLLPSSFKAMLESGFIPHLSHSAIEQLATRQAELFHTERSGAYDIQDEAGRRPYLLAEETFMEGHTIPFFSRLAQAYAECPSPPRPERLVDNLEWIRDYLKQGVFTVPGDDRHIAAIDIVAHADSLDLIVLGYAAGEESRPEALAIQVDNAGNVYGLPAMYGYAAEALLTHVINMSLEALAARGANIITPEIAMVNNLVMQEVERLLVQRMPRLRVRSKGSEAMLERLMHEEVRSLQREIKKRYMSELGPPTSEGLEPEAPDGKELRLPAEQPLPLANTKMRRRYTIEVPEEVLSKLSTTLQRRLLAAVRRVEYSPLGSGVMKKLKSFGGAFRIAFSGNRAILQKNGEGVWRVTDVLWRDTQTYRKARRQFKKRQVQAQQKKTRKK